MRSFDGAEICELVGIYILCFIVKIIHKNYSGLYRDDGLLILRNLNGQQIHRMCQNIINIFKDVGFAIDVETNRKIENSFEITFNLSNSTYSRTKSQIIYYRILINLQIIHHKILINYQKQSMNVYLEIPPVKKFLIHLNINTKKSLETVDTPISN